LTALILLISLPLAGQLSLPYSKLGSITVRYTCNNFYFLCFYYLLLTVPGSVDYQVPLCWFNVQGWGISPFHQTQHSRLFYLRMGAEPAPKTLCFHFRIEQWMKSREVAIFNVINCHWELYNVQSSCGYYL
jgi:hypothetical protein